MGMDSSRDNSPDKHSPDQSVRVMECGGFRTAFVRGFNAKKQWAKMPGKYPEGITSFSPALRDGVRLRWVRRGKYHQP